jgi:serine/threonine-protein kinase
MSGTDDPSDASTLDDTVRRVKDPLLGTTVAGRFEVKALLGQGGMGAVYLARQPAVGREVALKVLHRHYAADETLVKRFEREVHLCAQLVHPNVVVVHDAGIADGLIFMAMERLEGRTVSQLLEAGPLEPARACRLASQVCAALAAAHAKGIIHRDIKPSNVMVVDAPGAAELVKVLDFGIASVQDGTRLTQTHGVMGSPNAIAPEVILAPSNVSPRADLYAVGTMLFEMLTAQPPFGADNPNAVFVRQVSGAVPALPASVPQGLSALVESLMNPEPSHRPESAEVVRRALASGELLAVTAPAPAPSEKVAPAPRWARLAVACGALVVAAGVGWRVMDDASSPGPGAPVTVSVADGGAAGGEGKPDALALVPVDVPDASVMETLVPNDAGPSAPAAGGVDAGLPVRRKPPRRRSDYQE